MIGQRRKILPPLNLVSIQHDQDVAKVCVIDMTEQCRRMDDACAVWLTRMRYEKDGLVARDDRGTGRL